MMDLRFSLLRLFSRAAAMAQGFDPYHIWLAIPPEDQPPDHYRLLGVKAFESQCRRAGERRRPAAWRTSALSRRASTRPNRKNCSTSWPPPGLCLLNPEKRQAYDRELKAKLAAEKPAPPAPPSPAAPAPDQPGTQAAGHRPAARRAACGGSCRNQRPLWVLIRSSNRLRGGHPRSAARTRRRRSTRASAWG